MRHFNGSVSTSMHELQRAMYVYHMNVHKPRVKEPTKERHVRAVVEACREIVKEHDDAEAYRWFLLTSPTMIPALPDSRYPPFVITP